MASVIQKRAAQAVVGSLVADAAGIHYFTWANIFTVGKGKDKIYSHSNISFITIFIFVERNNHVQSLYTWNNRK